MMRDRMDSCWSLPPLDDLTGPPLRVERLPIYRRAWREGFIEGFAAGLTLAGLIAWWLA